MQELWHSQVLRGLCCWDNSPAVEVSAVSLVWIHGWSQTWEPWNVPKLIPKLIIVFPIRSGQFRISPCPNLWTNPSRSASRPLLLTTLCPERWALSWAFDNSGEARSKHKRGRGSKLFTPKIVRFDGQSNDSTTPNTEKIPILWVNWHTIFEPWPDAFAPRSSNVLMC